MTKTYERQDGETTKAYTAFSIYLDMGSARTRSAPPRRSLDRVEEKIYGTQIGHKRGTNLTSLKRWSREWNWVDRCWDYDRDREHEQRQIKSEHEKAAYVRDLENYHRQQKTIVMAALNFTTRSLDRTAVEFYPTPETPQKRPRNIAQIEVWSRTKNWVDRCKDFDRDEETILRDKIRQSSMEEHNRQLEQFRQNNEAIGFGLFKMGLRLLTIGEKIIKTLENKEVLDSKDIDLFLAIPNSIKAIGALEVV